MANLSIPLVAVCCLANIAGAVGCGHRTSSTERQSTRPPEARQPARPPAHPSTPQAPVGARSEIDALVYAVLDRELWSTRGLPDINLLPKRGPINVISPIRDTVLTPRALPPGRRPLRLATRDELQSMADRTGRSVFFVVVEVQITGDVADVSAGVDVLSPSSSTSIKLCCCTKFSSWVKESGRWRLDSKGGQICS